jgi:hypothetical protein
MGEANVYLLAQGWEAGSEGYSVNLPPKISLRVPEVISVEGRPIPLYIIVDHTNTATVDTQSFQLDEKPITVESIQQEKIAPEELFKDGGTDGALLVDTYRTVLPALAAGAHTIGPASVLVGGVPCRSNTIVVQVQGAVTSPDFRLELTSQSPPKIFPGQEVVFSYHIFFTGSMQLLREDLPLLNPPGFRNVGSPEITTRVVPGGNEQIIALRSKAVTPGTYEIGPSTIEGMKVDAASGRASPPLLRAEVRSSTIVILPFPEEGKPPSFDGALGAFAWRVRALGETEVTIGDSVRIEYRVSGRGELDSVRFPPLEQLSGLTDGFWTDPNPPLGEQADGTKQFILVVRPKRLGQVEVPGFFVTSFDPYSEQYLTESVAPISLTVEGTAEDAASLTQRPLTNGQGEPRPFDLDASTVSIPSVPPQWVGWTFSVAVVLGLLQLLWRSILRRRKGRKQVSSRELFYLAFKNRSNREKGLTLLRQALYVRLYELALTPVVVDSPEAIHGEGIALEAKTLIQAIERQLYGTEGLLPPIQEIYDEASSLYYRMKTLEAQKPL